MIKRSNFLKRPPQKNPQRPVSLPARSVQNKNIIETQPKASCLRRQELARFKYMFTFDRKVWVSFSNELQLCAMFDLHAVH